MAKVLNNGLLSGAVGDLIYYVINGKQYVKKKGKNNNPNTEKQKHTRSKMRACSKFLSQFRDVIKLGYQGRDLAYEDYNEAAKYHLANAFEDITPEGSTEILYQVIYEQVKFSRGLIAAPEIYTCKRTGQNIMIEFNHQLGQEPNRQSDALALIAYTPGKKPFTDFHAAVRFEGQAEVVLPPKMTDQVHVWLFFYNAEKTGVTGKECSSDSVYLGVL